MKSDIFINTRDLANALLIIINLSFFRNSEQQIKVKNYRKK